MIKSPYFKDPRPYKAQNKTTGIDVKKPEFGNIYSSCALHISVLSVLSIFRCFVSTVDFYLGFSKTLSSKSITIFAYF